LGLDTRIGTPPAEQGLVAHVRPFSFAGLPPQAVQAYEANQARVRDAGTRGTPHRPGNGGDRSRSPLLVMRQLRSAPIEDCNREDYFMPSATSHTRLEPVSPRNAVLLFVDQQQGLFSRIHEPDQTRRNLFALARSARLLGVPAVLTTALAAGPNGPQLTELTETFAGEEIIDRTLINAWQDSRVHDAVTRTGRGKVIIAGTGLDVCAQLPALASAAEGYDAYVVIDAPPLLPMPDCQLIGGFVDKFIVVLACDKTPRRALAEALNVLAPDKVLGLVFNRNDQLLSDYRREDYGEKVRGARWRWAAKRIQPFNGAKTRSSDIR